MAAAKKSTKTSAKRRSALTDPTPLSTFMVVLFTALSVVFAWIAYINYSY